MTVCVCMFDVVRVCFECVCGCFVIELVRVCLLSVCESETEVVCFGNVCVRVCV